jgi:hypothetical protein
LFFHPCLAAGKHRPGQLIFSSRYGMAVALLPFWMHMLSMHNHF